jgi:hypothetical protein
MRDNRYALHAVLGPTTKSSLILATLSQPGPDPGACLGGSPAIGMTSKNHPSWSSWSARALGVWEGCFEHQAGRQALGCGAILRRIWASFVPTGDRGQRKPSQEFALVDTGSLLTWVGQRAASSASA